MLTEVHAIIALIIVNTLFFAYSVYIYLEYVKQEKLLFGLRGLLSLEQKELSLEKSVCEELLIRIARLQENLIMKNSSLSSLQSSFDVVYNNAIFRSKKNGQILKKGDVPLDILSQLK